MAFQLVLSSVSYYCCQGRLDAWSLSGNGNWVTGPGRDQCSELYFRLAGQCRGIRFRGVHVGRVPVVARIADTKLVERSYYKSRTNIEFKSFGSSASLKSV